MLNLRSLLLACTPLVVLAQTPCQTVHDITATPVIDYTAPAGDPFAERVLQIAGDSARQVQAFFGAPYPDPIHFQVVPDRKAFDAAVASFGIGASECWMVGMGTGDLMVLLSPSVWDKQACEHKPGDLPALRQLITHELVHVYHGQTNSSRDFSGIDDLDWFVEGLAVFASGQLTPDREERLHALAAAGQLPVSLQKIWTGPDRYGQAGSLVAFVDKTWGRISTVRLMKAHSTAEALAVLGIDEKELLKRWCDSLVSAAKTTRPGPSAASSTAR